MQDGRGRVSGHSRLQQASSPDLASTACTACTAWHKQPSCVLGMQPPHCHQRLLTILECWSCSPVHQKVQARRQGANISRLPDVMSHCDACTYLAMICLSVHQEAEAEHEGAAASRLQDILSRCDTCKLQHSNAGVPVCALGSRGRRPRCRCQQAARCDEPLWGSGLPWPSSHLQGQQPGAGPHPPAQVWQCGTASRCA